MQLSKEIELYLGDFSHQQSRKEKIRNLLALETILRGDSSAEAGLREIVRSLRKKLDKECAQEVKEVGGG